jgi:serine protease Do
VRIVATDLESVRTIDRPPLRIGEIVFAVGNPLGDSHAITTGIISQLQPQTIVSDLQLFPGNSGGAMTDCQGNIVGINTAIAAGLAIARSTESVTNFLNIGKPMFI